MTLTLAAAQYPITEFSDFAQWKRHTAQWVGDAARRGARLLVFPEYGSMELASLLTVGEKADLRKQVGGLSRLQDDFQEIFAELARQWEATIVAPSFPVMEAEKMVNRAYIFGPKGLAGFQDKFFMTRFENEEWGVQSGQQTLKIFEAEWGIFGVQICYDVEFPLGTALMCAAGAELIVAPSCTETIRGATRVHVGARARALENQCFVAVAQTVGDASWSPAVDINYGQAAVYTTPDKGLPEEGIVALMQPQKPGWLVQEIDFEKIKNVRTAGQVFNFRDNQGINYGLAEKEIQVVREII